MSALLKLGSRPSPLATYQAEWTAKRLKEKNPDLQIEFVWIKSQGDQDATTPLSELGGKGVFVKEIEKALLEKKIDFAVHSLKDLPQRLPAGLTLTPFPEREDPRDAVLSRFGELLRELPKGSTVGTGSPRRKAQILRKIKRGYKIEGIRGNVSTRIDKMNDGQYDAIVLALAGLKRLGLDAEVAQILEPEEMLPSPGQGLLGLEIREEDSETLNILSSISHPEADAEARVERALLEGIGGSCSVPLGGLARHQNGKLRVMAGLWSLDGEKEATCDLVGDPEQPEWLGAMAAEKLLTAGGSDILFELEGVKVRD